MKHLIPFFSLATVLSSLVCAGHPFIDRLYEAAYKEVETLLAREGSSRVIALDESSYRRLVLPGSPFFRSIVLFFNSDREEHTHVLEALHEVAREFDKENRTRQDGGSMRERVLFFHVDLSDNRNSWIRSLHQLSYLPDIVRFGLRRTVLSGSGDKPQVDSFNEWVTGKEPDDLTWTPQLLGHHLLQFCREIPEQVLNSLSTADQIKELAKETWAWLLLHKFVLFIITCSILIALYTLVKHRRLFLTTFSIVVYAINISCVISALVIHSRYKEKAKTPPETIYDWVIYRFFTDTAKTQYLYEGAIVTVLIFSVSFLLLLLSQNVDNISEIRALALFSVIALVLAAMLMIIRHKKIPHSIDFLPGTMLPRGGIHVDRGFLF